MPLTSLGNLAMQAGDLASARSLLEEGLALRREVKHPVTIGISAKLSVGGGEGVCHSRPVAFHGLGPAGLPCHSDHVR